MASQHGQPAHGDPPPYIFAIEENAAGILTTASGGLATAIPVAPTLDDHAADTDYSTVIQATEARAAMSLRLTSFAM